MPSVPGLADGGGRASGLDLGPLTTVADLACTLPTSLTLGPEEGI